MSGPRFGVECIVPSAGDLASRVRPWAETVTWQAARIPCKLARPCMQHSGRVGRILPGQRPTKSQSHIPSRCLPTHSSLADPRGVGSHPLRGATTCCTAGQDPMLPHDQLDVPPSTPSGLAWPSSSSSSGVGGSVKLSRNCWSSAGSTCRLHAPAWVGPARMLPPAACMQLQAQPTCLPAPAWPCADPSCPRGRARAGTAAARASPAAWPGPGGAQPAMRGQDPVAQDPLWRLQPCGSGSNAEAAPTCAGAGRPPMSTCRPVTAPTRRFIMSTEAESLPSSPASGPCCASSPAAGSPPAHVWGWLSAGRGLRAARDASWLTAPAISCPGLGCLEGGGGPGPADGLGYLRRVSVAALLPRRPIAARLVLCRSAFLPADRHAQAPAAADEDERAGSSSAGFEVRSANRSRLIRRCASSAPALCMRASRWQAGPGTQPQRQSRPVLRRGAGRHHSGIQQASGDWQLGGQLGPDFLQLAHRVEAAWRASYGSDLTPVQLPQVALRCVPARRACTRRCHTPGTCRNTPAAPRAAMGWPACSWRTGCSRRRTSASCTWSWPCRAAACRRGPARTHARSKRTPCPR